MAKNLVWRLLNLSCSHVCQSSLRERSTSLLSGKDFTSKRCRFTKHNVFRCIQLCSSYKFINITSHNITVGINLRKEFCSKERVSRYRPIADIFSTGILGRAYTLLIRILVNATISECCFTWQNCLKPQKPAMDKCNTYREKHV